MSLGAAPHAVEPKKHSAPIVEATAIVPSGECLMPSRPGAEKIEITFEPSEGRTAHCAIATMWSYSADIASVYHFNKDYTI